jgi:hypothetical protein
MNEIIKKKLKILQSIIKVTKRFTEFALDSNIHLEYVSRVKF